MTTPPLVIAHRGSSQHHLENTLPAFQQALEDGADGLELDVFFSKDLKPVVVHDQILKRLFQIDLNVRETYWKELKSLVSNKGERLCLLDEVLTLYQDHFQVINVEVKSMGVVDRGYEKTLSGILKPFDTSKIVVSSFNPFHLVRLRRFLPDIRLVYLVTKKKQPFYIRTKRFVDRLKVGQIHLDAQLCERKKYRKIAESTPKHWYWTVDTWKDWLKCEETAPEAIITNFPALMKKHLRDRQKQK